MLLSGGQVYEIGMDKLEIGYDIDCGCKGASTIYNGVQKLLT